MKRTVEIFTVILTLFLLFAPYLQPVAAQASGWRDSSFGNEYDAADSGEVNAGGYTDRTVKGEMASLSCMIMPVFGVCTADKNKMGSLMKNSAVAYLGNYITLMYSNPPADLALWIRDTGRALGFFPKQVYAQGVGFSGLAPLLPLWKAFRNIAYLLLAIVMIIVGFMVMFRKKIDPKTVVTVQNALPRIVVTLLLITFSYAIVGLLIDIMYLIILLAVGVVKTTGLLPDPSGIPSLFGFKTQEQVFATGGLSTFIYDVFPWGPASLLQVVSQMLGLFALIWDQGKLQPKQS